MIYGEDEFSNEHVDLLLAYTHRESPFNWVLSLPSDTMHSFEHLCDLIGDIFYHFDPNNHDQKLLQQWRDPHKSIIHFWQHFGDLQFQAQKIQMKFSYLWDRFEYCLKKSTHPKRKLYIKPHSTFFIDGTTQSHVGAGTVSTDCPPPSHLVAPPLPSDVEDHAHTPVNPSHSPNITPLNFRADSVINPSSSHMNSFLRPPSLHSGVPPDDVVFCSSVLDSPLVVNEEQPTNGVGVAQPTCIVLHEEYEWELEH